MAHRGVRVRGLIGAQAPTHRATSARANWPNQRAWGAGVCLLPCLDTCGGGDRAARLRLSRLGVSPWEQIVGAWPVRPWLVVAASQLLNWWRIHLASRHRSGGSTRHPLWARPCPHGVARSSCRSGRQCRGRPSRSKPLMAIRCASRVCPCLARGQATPNTHPPAAGSCRGANGWGESRDRPPERTCLVGVAAVACGRGRASAAGGGGRATRLGGAERLRPGG